MIRFPLRFAGFLLIAAGFVALVIDGTRSIAGQRLMMTSISDTWRAIHFDSLGQVQKALQASGQEWLWDPLMLVLLALPTAAVGLGLGALLMLAGRRREPQIGVIGRR
ncbi:MAG: hypothetical protein FD152_3343 [Xanthobacteraceae bacterium]|nr:MAG: hypothetical protein FD152_3343 [Xanthobacteraceae bacterium]